MEEGATPILDKKKLVLIGIVFLVLTLGAGAVLLLTAQPSQDIPDSTEPQLEFAADGSKVAGIQVLVRNGGLSWEQYTAVYVELDKKLPALEPSARYFIYEEESLVAVASGREDYDAVEIEVVTDAVEEEVAEQATSSSQRQEMEVVDTVEFIMRSESGARYKVSVYTAGGTTKAEVKIEKQ